MSSVKRIVLDVLKPHRPNALEFARALADIEVSYRITLTVAEVDEKTESIIVIVEGSDIQFDALAERIAAMGGSIHSIDAVEVEGEPGAKDQ